MKSKRLLAIFLVLTMLVSLMPVGFAAGEEEEVLVNENELEEIVEELAEEPVEEEEVADLTQETSELEQGGEPTQEVEPAELVNIDHDITVRVQFNQQDDNGVTNVAVYTTSINSGNKLGDAIAAAEAKMSMFSSTGHTFVKWTIAVQNYGTAMLGAKDATDAAVKLEDDATLGQVVFSAGDNGKEGEEYEGTEPNDVIAVVTANFKISKYTVTFAVEPDGVATKPAKVEDVAYGTLAKSIVDAVVLTNVVAGYDGANAVWSINGTEIDENTKVTDNTTITATVPLFTKTFIFLNTTTPSTPVKETEIHATQSVTNGQILNKPATNPTAPTGQEFKEWENEADLGKAVEVNATETVSVKPVFTTQKFTVKFDVDGDLTKVPQQTVVYQGTATKPSPDPVKEGWSFGGWTLNGKAFDWSTKIVADITLVASWTKTPITLTYDYTDYSKKPAAEVNPLKVVEGKAGDIFTEFTDITPMPGYELKGWATEKGTKIGKDEIVGNPEKKLDFTKPLNASITVYPIYEPTALTITLDPVVSGATYVDFPDESSVVANISTKYDSAFVVEKPAEDSTDVWLRPLKNLAGHNFIGWKYVDDDGKDVMIAQYIGTTWTLADGLAPIQKAYALTAVWDDYATVTLKLGDKQIDSFWYNNAAVPYNTEADHQYIFHKDYYKDALGKPADMKFGAVAKNYAGDDATIAIPADPTATTATLPNKYFEGWYLNGTKVDLSTYVITEDVTFIAKWSDFVAVTFDYDQGTPAPTGAPDDKGTISVPVGKSFDDFTPVLDENGNATGKYKGINPSQYDSVPVIPVPKKTGMAFDHWNVTVLDGKPVTETEFKLTDPVQKSMTVLAKYKNKSWNVTLDPMGGTYSSDNPISVPDGQKVSIPGTIKKDDAVFLYWATRRGDGTIVPYSYQEFKPSEDGNEITEDLTLYAIWEEFEVKKEEAPAPTKGSHDGYYATLADAFDYAGKANLVLLKDVALADGYDKQFSANQTLNLNGFTISGPASGALKPLGKASGTENSNDPRLTVKNGTIENLKIYRTIFENGTFENVFIVPTQAATGSIRGGNFRFTVAGRTDFANVEAYVAHLNEKGKAATNHDLLEVNGYYTPVKYATLTAFPNDTMTVGTGDEYKYYAGEVTKESDIVVPKSGDKFLGWMTNNEEGEAVAFEFGKELTGDVAIWADWAENYTVTLTVAVPNDDGTGTIPVEIYSKTIAEDELIPAPKKPTEDEYASMPKSREESLRKAWAVIESEGFLGWRYDENEKNVVFGTDKPNKQVSTEVEGKNCVKIFGATRPVVTFVGLGNKVVKEVYVDDGKTFAQSGATVPVAPTESGYTFVNWYYAYGGLFDKDQIINGDVRVAARYTGTNWTISQVTSYYASGYSEVPATTVTFGGAGGLELYSDYPDGVWHIEYQIEAPEGVTQDINSDQWVYSKDGGTWKSFNDNADGLNLNKQLYMTCREDLSKDGLKELVDAKKTKTISFALAPKGSENDTSALVKLSVVIDPSNVALYHESKEQVAAGDVVPAFKVEDWKYKWTVTLDTDGGPAVNPILDVEYGTTFAQALGADYKNFVFADATVNKAFHDEITAHTAFNEAFRKVATKDWYKATGNFYYVGVEDDFSDTPDYVDFTDPIYGDTTVYAEWEPIPTVVNFWTLNAAKTGYEVKDGFTSYQTPIGGKLSELVIPEKVAEDYGKTAWYPVDVAAGQPVMKSKAANPYDVMGTDIIGGVYCNKDDEANFYITGDGTLESYTLNLVRGDETGWTVTFRNFDGDSDWVTYYEADESGEVAYGDLEIPNYKANEGREFAGWRLIPEDWHGDEDDLKVFDFAKHAKDKFSRNIEFRPYVKDLNGRVKLMSANVDFDGLIHLIFKYTISELPPNGANFWKINDHTDTITYQAYQQLNEDEKALYEPIWYAWTDKNTWDESYVVFATGETELARVALSDGIQDTTKLPNTYLFAYTCPVPIVNYTDTVNVKVVDKTGKEIETRTASGKPVEGGYDYSLETYAEKKESSSDVKMAELAKALQDYGIAARLFFGEPVGDLQLSDAVKNLNVASMDVNETVTTPKDQRPDGVSASQNVDFDSDNAMIVNFTVKKDGKYTFKINGVPVDIAPDANGKVTLRVNNIAPDKLNTLLTFSCTDDESGKSFEISTSVLGYAKRKAESGSENMQNLAKALYIYAEKANAYFA